MLSHRLAMTLRPGANEANADATPELSTGTRLMQIDREQAGLDVVLKVTGRLDTPNAKPFESSLLEAVNGSEGAITVDLAASTMSPRPDCAPSLWPARPCATAKRELVLRSLQPQIREVFDTLGSRPCSRSSEAGAPARPARLLTGRPSLASHDLPRDASHSVS